MFTPQTPPAPLWAKGLLKAAEAAARAIPPAFPLAATVAVNPFLGQSGEDLATASARLARVAGIRLTRPRAWYQAEVQAGRLTQADLAAALDARSPATGRLNLAQVLAGLAADGPDPQALPTVATLAAKATGTDWPAILSRTFGLWAAGHFDRGQALWSPTPGRSAFAAWRDWAAHDLTPEIAGLTGFCAHVAGAPDTPERAILRAADRLGLNEAAAGTAFHRLLMDLGGWAQHARWMLWQAELHGGSDATPTDLLAIRLIWEEALLIHAPAVGTAWARAVATHAEPVVPSVDQGIDALLQEAAERAHQRGLAALLGGARAGQGGAQTRPVLQAAFCIDVRSEVFRRALESVSPGIETLGFAGFFGIATAHRAAGTDDLVPHLPVLLTPAMTSNSHAAAKSEHAARIGARTTRAWGRFKQAAVSSFAFVEAAGPTYGWTLVKDSLRLGNPSAVHDPAPTLDDSLTPLAKAQTGAAILKAMSLTQGHARLVLVLGHGAQVTNNPHDSGYQCGACGGQTGEVSARLLARLLNDPETRAGLLAQGVTLPDDTRFIAGLHDTTTDSVTLFADDPAPGHAADHAADIDAAQAWLAQAGGLARAERAARLPGATAASIAARARNWAEVRPEWALAGCAAFIAAPRAVTAGADLQGRAFLHSYDWHADAGFGTLELILTAPVVVASWISLQYYGSAIAPGVFGGGNKVIHNVVGGIGVVQGNGGVLRPGLPWQSVHDGTRLVHDPLRLSVMIEAPQAAIAQVLARHDAVRALFDNRWLHLFALDAGQVAARYRPGLTWEAVAGGPSTSAHVAAT